ncbi:MAG: TolC family outer membrane protein [Magnetococcales bacterium]|nr:TolC family outer membrane protein [Magnetococcales bacterium]
MACAAWCTSKRKRRFWPCCLGLLTVWSGLSQQAEAQTLPEAVQSALRETPRIEAARRALQAIRARKARAISGYLPSLDLSLGTGEEWNDTTTTRLTEGENRLRRGELQVTLNQPLFDGFSTWHQVAENDARERTERAALDSAADEVALDTVLAYLEVLKQRELHQLLQEQERLHRQILARVQDMASLGLSTSVDAELSQSRLKLIVSDLVSASGAGQKAATRFRRLVGREPGPLEPAVLSPATLPGSLEIALEQALRLNATLMRSKGELASTTASHAGNHARYWPKLGLDVGYSNTDNVGGTRGYNENVRAMVRLNVNLFHGGSDLATVRESAEQVGRSQGLLDEVQATVLEDVRVAWDRMQTARERLARLDEHLESKQKVTSAYHEQFRMGLRPLLDVLNSENELTSARNARVNESYEQQIAGYRLLAVVGLLRTVFVGDQPALPAPSGSLQVKVEVEEPSAPETPAVASQPLAVETLDQASELLWQESSALVEGIGAP